MERREADGQPLFIWFTVFKATDRYTYEQNLKEAKASLEISLANAQQVTTLRDQFIAILGHDLRNPLGSIMAGVSILSKSMFTGTGTKIIQIINRSSLRMAELINNIMDFARTRLGEGIVVNRQPTLWNRFYNRLWKNSGRIYPTRQIETIFELKIPSYATVHVWRSYLSNLVANAITHGIPDTPVQVFCDTKLKIYFEMNSL